MGIVVVVTCYLFFLALSERHWSYFLIGLFAIGSIGFLYSSDYFFNKVLEPHQQIRIKVLLGMEEDLAGAGYNVNQSKIAIGSGGLTGKGFLNGTQTKLKYVPEQDTDFIFCTVGEEEGFIGSTGCITLVPDFDTSSDSVGRAAAVRIWQSIRVFGAEYFPVSSFHKHRDGTRIDACYRLYSVAFLQLWGVFVMGLSRYCCLYSCVLMRGEIEGWYNIIVVI